MIEESFTLAAGDCLSEIQELVRHHTGLDLTCYRRAMVARRIANRMITVGISSLADYVDYVRGKEGEASQLIRHISIKVSRFYRNPSAFDCLRSTAVPELTSRAPLAVWSIGTARGEEAYTLAMLLEEARIEGSVYATDIDGAALAAAREATYGDAALADMPAGLREAYLRPAGEGRWQVTPCVRERVRFALHDVISGAVPPGQGPFDLICCRNLLIYLNQDVHALVFRMMHGALAPGGYLLLGEAEWTPPGHAQLLRTVSASARLFRRS